MGVVIAFMLHKGGAGKTATTINVGAALSAKKKKVLLIDMDPQATLTKIFGLDGTTAAGVPEILSDGTQSRPKQADGMDVIVSSMELQGVEQLRLPGMLGRENKLKQYIKAVRGKYDFILIDCPPSVGLLTINALTAADFVFLPMEAELATAMSLQPSLEVIENVRANSNTALKVGGVILTKYDGRLVVSRIVEGSLKKEYGGKVLKTKIRRNVSVIEATLKYQSVVSYAPQSNGAKDYKELATEVVKIINYK